MNYLSEAPQRQPRAWCYGGGVDSTAGIIQDINRGVQIDLITMADHGGEKQGTYDFLPIFSDWIHERIGLRPELCKYEPMEKTS
ncbi:MAG TPA: hypothetical protein PL183_09965, partial [Aquamicrobium sp.]|nr:hypothetical protein [Aquamicrobium sp.]